MIIMDNRTFYYQRTDGKPICFDCKYMNEYNGCLIKANEISAKYPFSCAKYNSRIQEDK